MASRHLVSRFLLTQGKRQYSSLQSSKLSLLSSLNSPITRTSLRFVQDDPIFHVEKPYHFSGPLEFAEESRRSNLSLKPQEVLVTDLRGHFNLATIDNNGFQLEYYRSKFLESLQQSKGLQSYMNETVSHIKELFDAQMVVCFDYRVRNATTLNTEISLSVIV